MGHILASCPAFDIHIPFVVRFWSELFVALWAKSFVTLWHKNCITVYVSNRTFNLYSVLCWVSSRHGMDRCTEWRHMNANCCLWFVGKGCRCRWIVDRWNWQGKWKNWLAQQEEYFSLLQLLQHWISMFCETRTFTACTEDEIVWLHCKLHVAAMSVTATCKKRDS